tara:strand:+ start:11 stop:634 length:624 start_codon:yes stop_codon:yes gene_type:complete
MEVKLITEPLHYLLIENVYDDFELDKIWSELDYLNNICGGLDTGRDTGGKYSTSKSNKGVFLDYMYNDRKYSNILTCSKKLLDREILNQKDSWFFRHFAANRDTTLVSYYETDDEYPTHYDMTFLTICTWLYKEPKKFTGGNFSFPEYDVTIECKNNTAVAFCGRVLHSVSPVKMHEDDLDTNHGRYCISQFLLMEQQGSDQSNYYS